VNAKTVTTWRDFSGAPALLLPRTELCRWNGMFNPTTGLPGELNLEVPVTDYDRACKAAWPGVGLVPVGTLHGLALYSEDDTYAWLPEQGIVASGSWVPDEQTLSSADWGDPIVWKRSSELVLVNSAANAAQDLRDEDVLNVWLPPGEYRVEFAFIKASHWGWFHRFTLSDSTAA
jgi:hypothetical protein